MQSNTFPRTIVRTIAERRPLIMSVVVLGWSIKYTISLGLNHTTGPEAYGVLTAALSTGAALANLALLRSPRMSTLVVGAVLVLWAVVALGGVAGTLAHVVGPVAGHGPVDLRPRPIPAPLVFTVLGTVGGTALVLGRRAAGRRGRNQDEV
jgi:hypothetical protein